MRNIIVGLAAHAGRSLTLGLILISALGCSTVRTYNDVPMDGTLPGDQPQAQEQVQTQDEPTAQTNTWLNLIALAFGINNSGGQPMVYNGPHYTSAARSWGRHPIQYQPQQRPAPIQRSRPSPIFSGRPTLQRQVGRESGGPQKY